MVINSILDKFTEGFYFSSGGIGDFLLLLSSIYKKQNNLNTNIIYWADNKEHIQQLINIFKKENGIKKSLIYSGFQSKEQYDCIIKHKYFKGKCHFPDNIQYVNEWYNNYEQYHSEFDKRTNFINEFVDTSKNNNKDKHIIGIGVFGSRKESHKIKHLNTEEFNILLQRLQTKYPDSLLYIFGSPIDKQEFPIDYNNINGKNIYDYRMEPLEDSLKYIIDCKLFYSTDTWYKTVTHFLNIPTTIIETTYEGMNDNNKKEYMEQLFGNGIEHDAGNDIFLLHGWQFDFIKKVDIGKI